MSDLKVAALFEELHAKFTSLAANKGLLREVDTRDLSFDARLRTANKPINPDELLVLPRELLALMQVPAVP